MDEQVNRREKTGSTPRVMTNNSSVGAIIPVAPLKENSTPSENRGWEGKGQGEQD